jgi:hypothetical protein
MSALHASLVTTTEIKAREAHRGCSETARALAGDRPELFVL